MMKTKTITNQKKNKNKKNKSFGQKDSVSVFGLKPSVNQVTAPMSVATELRNATYMDISKGRVHSDYGPAIRISGMQLGWVIAATGNTPNVLFGGLADVIEVQPGASAYINPSNLNGRFSAIAINYVRYAFRKIRFLYVTRSPTTVEGNFVMAYCSDSALFAASAGPYPKSYPALNQLQPSVINQYWNSTCLDVEFTGERTWYTAYNIPTLVESQADALRQAVQGIFLMKPDATPPAGTYGEVFIEYVCDLYQPIPTNTGEGKILMSIRAHDVHEYLLHVLRDEKKVKLFISFLKELGASEDTKNK